jgi:hypothetical protein
VSRLFISHSSRNNDWALALQTWLIREGWSGENDIFLDLDPERGIVAGQRWARALEDAATRCEAVLLRSSPKMQPYSSDAVPISCGASTRCAVWRRASRRACWSFSAPRAPASLHFCVRGYGRDSLAMTVNGCHCGRSVPVAAGRSRVAKGFSTRWKT